VRPDAFITAGAVADVGAVGILVLLSLLGCSFTSTFDDFGVGVSFALGNTFSFSFGMSLSLSLSFDFAATGSGFEGFGVGPVLFSDAPAPFDAEEEEEEVAEEGRGALSCDWVKATTTGSEPREMNSHSSSS
jgi:hypothetical protein